MRTLQKSKTIGLRDGLYASYMRDISKKIMTREEETEAFRRYKEEGDLSARDALINANQLFVVKVARSYANDSNIMDLISEGNKGLIYAVDHFDHKSGNHLISYALWYIRREISQYLINQDSMVKKSNNMKMKFKITKIKDKFMKQHERVPSTDEIKELMKSEYGIVVKDDSDLYDMTISSIAAPVNDDDDLCVENASFFNEKTSNENDYMRECDNEYTQNMVSILFSCLNKREETIMKMSFGIGYYKEFTVNEIADELGLTRERIRQIKTQCLKKMKNRCKTVAQAAV